MKLAVEKEKFKTAERDFSVDNLKGFLIILVILGHGGLLTSFKSPLGDFLQGYIYLFHMPLFFGLSALFIKEFTWAYFRKRFVQLMVPFYFFVIIDPINIIYYLIHPGFSGIPLIFDLNLKEFLKRVFVGSGVYLQNAFWFLPALFLSNISFSVLYKFRFNKLVILTFGLIFYLTLVFSEIILTKHYCVPYGIDTVIYILPLLFLLHNIYLKKPPRFIFRRRIALAGVLFSSILVLDIIPKKPAAELSGRLNLDAFYVPNTIWGYVLICSLSAFIFILFLTFNKKSIFSRIGAYTMPIFILHAYPWFTWFKFGGPALFLIINVTGNILIIIVISKTLIKISPKFRLIGMVA